jgi:hypothetical protein
MSKKDPVVVGGLPKKEGGWRNGCTVVGNGSEAV